MEDNTCSPPSTHTCHYKTNTRPAAAADHCLLSRLRRALWLPPLALLITFLFSTPYIPHSYFLLISSTNMFCDCRILPPRLLPLPICLPATDTRHSIPPCTCISCIFKSKDPQKLCGMGVQTFKCNLIPIYSTCES